jgi:hypothetical protein
LQIALGQYREAGKWRTLYAVEGGGDPPYAAAADAQFLLLFCGVLE